MNVESRCGIVEYERRLEEDEQKRRCANTGIVRVLRCIGELILRSHGPVASTEGGSRSMYPVHAPRPVLCRSEGPARARWHRLGWRNPRTSP